MNWNNLFEGKEQLSVTTDSRQVKQGSIFVALKGEHFDGNDYVEQAQKAGAAYIIQGPNALSELQEMAKSWRRWLGVPVVAITGTNGKTTTKELTATILKTKYNLHYTQGNYNNSLGVPLTILQLTRSHNMAIIEMGASHPGDITELVNIAQPDYGLITNVGRAHLQGFGSFEGVQKTKAELYDYLLNHQGVIFRNADNPYLQSMLADAQKRVEVSDCKQVLYHSMPMPSGTQLVGDYNAENIAAAMAIGEYFGVSKEVALEAVRQYTPSNNRSQAMTTEHNSLVIDAYNANPTSMQAALNAFKGDTYILGEMRELGDYSHTEHQNIVNMLLERKAESVYLVGQEYAGTTAPYPVFDDVNALADYLRTNPLEGRKILIKGSRGNKLENIIPLL